MKLDTRDYEAKMKKTIAAYSDNLSTIRAGRANPDVLKRVTVDYYGSSTPIASIAPFMRAMWPWWSAPQIFIARSNLRSSSLFL